MPVVDKKVIFRLMYLAYVYSRLKYDIVFLGSSSEIIVKVFRLQKRRSCVEQVIGPVASLYVSSKICTIPFSR